MGRAAFALLGGLLAAAIFAALNLASNRVLAPVRLDFTQNRLFTLSAGAKTVVQRLVEPVDLELVRSAGAAQQYPAVRAHGERIRELLHEIAARSGGKVRIRETDPKPLSDEEDRVTAAGIRPIPTDGRDPLYLGVIGGNSVADVIAIPYLAPERDALLEYDLVRLIAQLDDPKPPKVAVLSAFASLQGDGRGEGDAFILRELARAFTVVPVAPDFATLPPDTDILLIVHPPQLTPWQLYVVDQFLLRRGRALIALDPVSRVGSIQMRPQLSSSLGPIEGMLGVRVGPEAVADRVLGLPVDIDLGAGRREVQGQPLYPAPPPALMSRSDPVTADLSRPIDLGAPGRIEAHPVDGVRLDPLVETTDQAALIALELAASDPPPRTVMEAYRPTGAAFTLAARISGDLTTAFPEGPPPADQPADPVAAEHARADIAQMPERVATSQTPAQVILVADADLFDDGFFINPSTGAPLADNAAFILNAMDSLAGDNVLVALRSRAPAARPMTRIDQMRTSANQRLYTEQAELETRLHETEARLARLEGERSGRASGQRLERAEAARSEVEAFRSEAKQIRGRLRAVEREYRRDIDNVSMVLRIVNVWAPPLLAGLAGLGVALWRSRRRGGAQ